MFKGLQTYLLRKKQILCPVIFYGYGTVILLEVVAIVFVFAIWWLNHNPSLEGMWKDFHGSNDIIGTFCERLQLDKPVRQPVNTFSSIFYLMAAIIIFKKTWLEKKNNRNYSFNKTSFVPEVFFGFVLLYVFCASSFYHASLIKPALKLDYSAVYFFSLFPAMFFSWRRSLISNGRQLRISNKALTIVFHSIYIIIAILLSFYTPKGKEHIVIFINILIFFSFSAATAFAKPKKNNVNYLLLSMVCIVVALVWFELDKYRILCNPDSYFQPHSFWNLFIALSGFYFYVYMRNEGMKPATPIKMHSV
ncbi:hypothetical protein [Sediminibacterium sp.]|uniref:hypothetical protein n=1 Tax=Sediminibacterium sp. TaxID=1917865 RepID=UPI00272F97FE|nr:hypothetical protein [Sediminibacterium sp.]MDP2421400.1 hypothetical protein [Sediminibacterium sp.]